MSMHLQPPRSSSGKGGWSVLCYGRHYDINRSLHHTGIIQVEGVSRSTGDHVHGRWFESGTAHDEKLQVDVKVRHLCVTRGWDVKAKTPYRKAL
jgi:hypothetical protein